jgi:predicted amidohydrolase
MTNFKIALLQSNSGNTLSENLNWVKTQCEEISHKSVDCIFMPENIAMMEWGREAILAKSFSESQHPALDFFKSLAQTYGFWVHCGTLTIRLDNGKLANRTYIMNPQGQITDFYDKIHMFDVDLGHGEVYQESANFCAGDRSVIAKLPWGKLGLTICYDLRFPHLFRRLAQQGACYFAVPAAFTKTTGIAHWQVLLRARALETGSYIFAPAQTGSHAGGRETYGHSMIIDPWGSVMADAGSKPGWIMAEINPEAVTSVRQKIPSLNHDRSFS